MSVRLSVRALLAPVTCAAALLAAGPAAAAATAPAATAPAASATPPAATADRVQTTLRDVVDLQLLQPTCGERGALTAAAVDALHTIGIEAKLTGLPTLDLGPLGWIGFGTQHPGQAVAVELHLLPNGSAPVTLTLGAKPCPTAASATPTARAATSAPATAAPAGKPAAATAAPQAAAGPELAHTGGSGTPTWPYVAVAGALLTAGAVTTGVARRRAGRG
ncbi:hypothetical protein GCM10023205_42920 [Yinghuangia aomiensis]|uniref:LPXTG-motif cell wall anchor domain-containing protein n=1 Tax=Yinghuangia aomiensis TaxID=676205 RepID=A0ABP9HJU2_9ACTN